MNDKKELDDFFFNLSIKHDPDTKKINKNLKGTEKIEDFIQLASNMFGNSIAKHIFFFIKKFYIKPIDKEVLHETIAHNKNFTQGEEKIEDFGKKLGIPKGNRLKWLWNNNDLFKTHDKNEKYIINFYELIRRARTLEHYLYLASLFRQRGYYDEEREYISHVFEALEEYPINLTKSIDHNNHDCVSLILKEPLRDNIHSSVIIQHIAALGASKKIKKINIIYLSESFYNSRIKNKTAVGNKIILKIEKKLRSVPEKTLGESADLIIRKLNVMIPINATELDDSLSSIVIRFQGAGTLPSHHLFLKSIYDNRFVATITFSSHVKDSKYTDIILSRNKKDLSKKEIQYSMPLAYRELSEISLEQYTEKENTIVSVYGGKRIVNFFRNEKIETIKRIDEILCGKKISNWMLVGVSDVDEVTSEIKKIFSDTAAKKITVFKKTSLSNVYSSAKVFLALPGVFGGGGGAVDAVAYGVPILSVLDRNSDISNILDDSNQFESIESALEFLSAGIYGPQKLYELGKKQRSSMHKKFELSTTGNEIHSILRKHFSLTHSIRESHE